MFVIEARRNRDEKEYLRNDDIYADSALDEQQKAVRELNAQLGWSKYRIRMLKIREI